MRVLVTGATGFLGLHVLRALRREVPAADLAVLVRDERRWTRSPAAAVAGGVAVIVGTVEEPGRWRLEAHPRTRPLHRPPGTVHRLAFDAVLHLAGVVRHGRADADRVHRTNVDGTLAVVRFAAERGARVVLVSTGGVVAGSRDPAALPDETAPLDALRVARWPYFHSKLVAEVRGRALAQALGVRFVVVRPPVLLGPEDYGGRSVTHVTRILDRRLPVGSTGGMHFTDVRAAAAALVRVVGSPDPRPVYHLPGEHLPLRAFWAYIERAGGGRAPRVRLGRRRLRVLGLASGLALRLTGRSPLPDPVVIEMGSHWWGFSSRWARDELGWDPPPGARTLGDTLSWLERR